MATQQALEQTLREAGERFHVLPLGREAAALVTQRGARVLGLFPTPDSDNLLWTNSALDAGEMFQAFVASGNWNLGGERCWIAPEIQYNVRDRTDFWNTLFVSPQIDPGNYSLTADGETVRLEQSLHLTAYNTATGDKTLHLTRTIRPVPNPLQRHPAFTNDVTYCGYEQTATLSDISGASMHSEVWNLVQVRAGGTLVIPTFGDVQSSAYAGDVPSEARQPRDGALHIQLSGQQQFKVGYQSVCLTGRMGYFHPQSDGSAYLLVRNFFNDPSNLYAEEPPDQPGGTGHSVHVYNDGGEFGGDHSFGEMEVNGRTIGGSSGRATDTSTFTLWAFTGPSPAIQRIAQALLGSTPS